MRVDTFNHRTKWSKNFCCWRFSFVDKKNHYKYLLKVDCFLHCVRNIKKMPSKLHSAGEKPCTAFCLTYISIQTAKSGHFFHNFTAFLFFNQRLLAEKINKFLLSHCSLLPLFVVLQHLNVKVGFIKDSILQFPRTYFRFYPWLVGRPCRGFLRNQFWCIFWFVVYFQLKNGSSQSLCFLPKNLLSSHKIKCLKCVLSLLVQTGPTDTCGADGITVSVLQLAAPIIALPVAHLIALSFAQGKVPSAFKAAIVVPVHKGKGKPANQPSSYRPVAILPALSKVLEKVALSRLDPFLKNKTTPMSVWLLSIQKLFLNGGCCSWSVGYGNFWGPSHWSRSLWPYGGIRHIKPQHSLL